MFISCLVYQYWHKAKRILGLRVISPLALGCEFHPADYQQSI
jgi:hypothetical protein